MASFDDGETTLIVSVLLSAAAVYMPNNPPALPPAAGVRVLPVTVYLLSIGKLPPLVMLPTKPPTFVAPDMVLSLTATVGVKLNIGLTAEPTMPPAFVVPATVILLKSIAPPVMLAPLAMLPTRPPALPLVLVTLYPFGRVIPLMSSITPSPLSVPQIKPASVALVTVVKLSF